MFAVRKLDVGLGNDLVEAGFVPDSGAPSAAAGEHYAGAERLLAALLLARRGAERTAAYQPAQGHAAHAIAAVLLGSAEWQTTVRDKDSNRGPCS
jgi:hypothetical protein